MRLLRGRVRGELPQVLLGRGEVALEPVDASLQLGRAGRFGLALRGEHRDLAVACGAACRVCRGDPAAREKEDEQRAREGSCGGSDDHDNERRQIRHVCTPDFDDTILAAADLS
jgi:hypothetical protein